MAFSIRVWAACPSCTTFARRSRSERLIYVADSGHVPYGDKSPSYIEQRSHALTRFLIEQGADAIVIACNTATAAAVASLRSQFDIPIVGMEPAVKPAVAATRSGVVGVLATVGTLESARFAALLERYGEEVEIVTQGCPGLVEQVERGELNSARTRELIERYTVPLLARGADTLILGCTHYPFLASADPRGGGQRTSRWWIPGRPLHANCSAAFRPNFLRALPLLPPHNSSPAAMPCKPRASCRCCGVRLSQCNGCRTSSCN